MTSGAEQAALYLAFSLAFCRSLLYKRAYDLVSASCKSSLRLCETLRSFRMFSIDSVISCSYLTYDSMILFFSDNIASRLSHFSGDWTLDYSLVSGTVANGFLSIFSGDIGKRRSGEIMSASELTLFGDVAALSEIILCTACKFDMMAFSESALQLKMANKTYIE